MKNFLPVFLIAIILIVSCRKDDAIETLPPVTVSQQQEKVTDYYPLTVGSYWIYHVYNIDTNLIDYYWTTDTITIVKDTLLNGKKFYWQKGKNWGQPFSQFVTDSLDYIIHDDGHILFSHTNFTDTLLIETIPNYSTSYFKMINRGSIVSVPAGIFITIDRDKISHFNNPNYLYGNPRTATRYYARGVGLVKQRDYFDSSPEWLERRLVQYHVAE